ncbi:MAG TPA: hypothetical protein PKN33_13510 [Phycisphaerae bacterium]|nr:hypothetical protein [Phycisphaerales bacterium]HNO79064.1 hypothetical protein [Phycisphaerae bacterium]
METNHTDKLDEINELKQRLMRLESEVHGDANARWTPPKFYFAYELMGGMTLGLIAAGASLLFNIIGASMMQKHPLELIRVYLTFPMGEKALTLDSDFALAAGVCLYLLTGMIGGIPIHLILSRYFANAAFGMRFVVATILGLGVWVVNFYGLIAWLQPKLIGGNWILDNIPIWVAIATHLVFAWTMLVVGKLGQFVPSEKSLPPVGAN